MITLDIDFFYSIQSVHFNDDNADESLEWLVESPHFVQTCTFHSKKWENIVRTVDMKYDGFKIRTKKVWKELVKPALFLAIRTIDPDEFDSMFEHDMCEIPISRSDSLLYTYLINAVSTEIQRDLFDGNTFYEYITHETEWPADPEEPEEPYDDAFYYDGPGVEDEALDTVVLEQVRDMVSDMEWEIITAEHGDGPALAEKYETTVNNIWVIKFRTLKKLQEIFCKE